MADKWWHKWVDAVDRTAWTFVEAFIASVVLTNGMGIGDLKIAAGAGLIAALKAFSINNTVRGQMKVLGNLKKSAPRRR